ncbi:MAG TPA: NAD(P)/FAD-dependent oxidoreductase [Candidatus Limnocylindrales bacterium]|nr:NAD(P)/FAD-dependent oxidoreductase [Candidatus Limnocylindrales bacterium]
MHKPDVVVIGGGQAGLAASAMLIEHGVDHVVLERDSIASRWRQRWNSFTLVTPNWTVRLPRGEYDGSDPDGFLPRDEIVAHLEQYAERIGAPVVTGIDVTEVTARNGGYRIATSDGPYDARAVIVATGTFQRPKRPPIGQPGLGILDLHSSDYRSPDELPPGGVLVVGNGQSGAQIAEELHEAGRRVVLSVGRATRAPRRYRGRDVFRWLEAIGLLDRPVEALDSPAERFAANPHVSGKRGGHTLNLHRFARDGIRLTGRLTGIEGSVVRFAPDLAANLAASDEFANGLRSGLDEFIVKAGIDAPPPDPADDYDGRDGFDQPETLELDLAAEGIGTILWSAGYAWDFSWVRPARLDEYGYPIQRADYADSRGLYFLGLHFLHRQKSGIFYGVGDEARAIAAHIAGHA